jgi:hypothetical protein
MPASPRIEAMPAPSNHRARSRSSNALATALQAVAALLLVDRCQASWVPNLRNGHATYFPAIDACVHQAAFAVSNVYS